MPKETPDHHDAELVLRAYELRRDPVMRDSRRSMLYEFWPQSADEAAALVRTDHPLNAAYRQVTTYWEMIYGMVRHGVVHAEYFLETNVEGLFVFAKLAPYLERLRAEHTPLVLRNAEWVARECPPGQRLFEVISARVRRLAEARKR
ncbi:MAG TPA: hypothetical protein VF310_06705 [Vicinamibacteria bacterium]|jgi:hypothetical protein